MFVYMLRNSVNGKCYIGQTTLEPNERLAQHKHTAFGSGYKKCAIHHAIKKHGWENFDKFVLEVCESKSELDTSEIYWISRYEAMTPNGYNLREGGSYGKHTPETIEKIRNSHLGKKLSAEHIESCRIGRLGFKHSEETKQRHSEMMKGRIPYAAIARVPETHSGEGNGNSKLTWEVVRSMRLRHSFGDISCANLASEYEVDRRSVERIIKNERWKKERDPIHVASKSP